MHCILEGAELASYDIYMVTFTYLFCCVENILKLGLIKIASWTVSARGFETISMVFRKQSLLRLKTPHPGLGT